MTIKEIIEQVAAVTGVPADVILGKGRVRRIARARQVAMVLSRELTGQSYPRIGRAFRRDHSTVIHATQQVEAWRRSEPHTIRQLAAARQLIGARGLAIHVEELLTL